MERYTREVAVLTVNHVLADLVSQGYELIGHKEVRYTHYPNFFTIRYIVAGLCTVEVTCSRSDGDDEMRDTYTVGSSYRSTKAYDLNDGARDTSHSWQTLAGSYDEVLGAELYSTARSHVYIQKREVKPDGYSQFSFETVQAFLVQNISRIIEQAPQLPPKKPTQSADIQPHPESTS